MSTASRRAFHWLVAAIALVCALGSARASIEDEVRAAFDRFVQAERWTR